VGLHKDNGLLETEGLRWNHLLLGVIETLRRRNRLDHALLSLWREAGQKCNYILVNPHNVGVKSSSIDNTQHTGVSIIIAFDYRMVYLSLP